MQRAKATPPKVSTSMRKSMLQLQLKARWLRPGPDQSVPRRIRIRPKKSGLVLKDAPKQRAIESIVEEYRKTLDRLEEIESELEAWLNEPEATSSIEEAPASSPLEPELLDVRQ